MSKTNKTSKSIRVNLPSSSILNASLIEELKLLFDLVPPHMLCRSVQEIFWNYLCTTNQEDLHPQFKENTTDFKYLLQFLELAEKQEEDFIRAEEKLKGQKK